MTRKKRISVLAFFFFLAAGPAIYVSLLVEIPHFTILDHSLRIEPLSFALYWSLGFFLMAILWILLARAEAAMTGSKLDQQLSRGWPAFLPFVFFFLSPVLLSDYITKEDLRRRLVILAGLILATFLATTLARRRREPGLTNRPIERLTAWFGGLSRKKKIITLFLVAFLIYNLAVFVLVAQGITFSGDEPNYLITTDSLFYDHDINLANNYADQSYFHFYSREDHPRLKLGVYGRYGKKGPGYLYPINLPGISFLMLPFYALSRLASGKALTFILKGSLSIWAALFGVQIYLFALDKWKRERLSLTLWAVFSFTAPVFFYAVHLYPEIPIAFMSLLIYRRVSSPRPLKTLHLLGLGFLLATFFWFGVKYNLLFWPLLLVSAYHLWKTHGARSQLMAFLALPIVSAGCFEFYIYSLYGTLSPFSIYEGIMTAEQFQGWKRMVLGIPFRSRLDTLFDYFLDQRDGLLFYSPLYVFAFLGFVEMFKKARRELFFLLITALPFILNYSFFTHRQGYAPQGRVLTPLAWIAAIAVGYFLAGNDRPAFSGAFRLLALASLAVAVVLFFHPSFLYQPTTHEFTERPGDLFVYLGNMHVFLPGYLPSFIKVDNSHYLPNFIWIAVIAGFILAYVLYRKKTEAKPIFSFLLVFILLGGGFFLWALYPRDSLYSVEALPSEKPVLGLHTFPLDKGVVIKPSGDLYLHIEKKYRILFSSRRNIEQIKIAYGSEKGEYEIRARFFDLPLFEDKTMFEKKEFAFRPAACYRIKGLCLYEIDVELKKYSSENMLLDPFYLLITPVY